MAQNQCAGAERFDVVDRARQAVESRRRWEWWLEAWVGAKSLERVHQCGFLAANVSTCAAMYVNLEFLAGAAGVLAEDSRRSSLENRRLEPLCCEDVLAAHVNVANRRADAEASDHHAFDELVRVGFHQVTVFVTAGFGFVGIAEHVVLLAGVLGDERPF